jgi:hypothetical protein
VLAGGLEWADPTDLDGLREALELADPERRLAPIGMSRVEIGPEALYLLPEVVAELTRGPHVVLLVDATPARFGDLDPPVAPEIARWALGNCHLMRNRFTLADLLFHLGWWDDAFVEVLLERARSAGGGL